MMSKLKELGSTLWAVVLTVLAVAGSILAFAYGKKTPSVLRAHIRAHNARGKRLNDKYEAAMKKAEAAQSQDDQRAHMERANTLKVKREDVERERLKLVQESGDLDATDVGLARRHTARARRAGSASG